MDFTSYVAFGRVINSSVTTATALKRIMDDERITGQMRLKARGCVIKITRVVAFFAGLIMNDDPDVGRCILMAPSPEAIFMRRALARYPRGASLASREEALSLIEELSGDSEEVFEYYASLNAQA